MLAAIAITSGCASDEEPGKEPAAGGAAGFAGMSGGVGGMATGGTGGMATGGTGGMATGGTGGMASGGMGGMPSGGMGGMPSGGMGGMPSGGMGGMDPDAGMLDPDAGGDGDGDGDCCADCICRDAPPSAPTTEDGPYQVDSYDLSGVGCVYYPTDADPPFAAVAVADGLNGSGGCGRTQTSGWGPFYASHGIVTMIVETRSSARMAERGEALIEGVEGFKAENEESGSPLFGKLAGRYGTSGFSMGGGGTTYAASDDPTLKTSVGLMAYGPIGDGITVPTLFICGSSDGIAPCSQSSRAYGDMPDSTPKMWLSVAASHAGQPTAGRGMSGANALVFQKVYLEGDERWRPLLLGLEYEATTIE